MGGQQGNPCKACVFLDAMVAYWTGNDEGANAYLDALSSEVFLQWKGTDETEGQHQEDTMEYLEALYEQMKAEVIPMV